MSDVSDYNERLDLREQVARIDRLTAETQTFQREANKRRAEEHKYDRDRFLAPSLAIVGIMGGLVAIATLLPRASGHWQVIATAYSCGARCF